MNERRFRIFYEVAIYLNMTEVAEKLYISQPAVSQAIQDLEAELQVKLFDRIGRKLFLTYEGELFLNYVRRIINLYDEGVNAIKEINNLDSGKLRIGASTTIGIYILPAIIGEYKKLHKGVDISIFIENTKNIANLILENKIDFAFVEGPVYSDELIVEKFCDDELVLITTTSHPWAAEKVIEPDKIAKEKVIMREIGSGTRDIFEREMNRNNIDYKVHFELGHTEAIKKAVEVGMGVSCISKRCVENEVTEGRLSIVKLQNINIFRQLNLVYHKDKYVTNLIQSFTSFAQEQVSHS